VIVLTERLGEHAGIVAMVDGGFDPLHAGHIAYFEAAAALGAPVLCNVSGDHYVATKHPPLLPEDQRVRVIDAIRWISFTHLSQTSTEEILERLRPRFYVKGADWQGRLPAEQVRLCAQHGIEIRYVDTVLDSSSRLMREYLQSGGQPTTTSSGG
jgi:D-beta-D-heptose 7-phosphate kinase/D-beta-D-heptose 1-phosphate adenosyltransferase